MGYKEVSIMQWKHLPVKHFSSSALKLWFSDVTSSRVKHLDITVFFFFLKRKVWQFTSIVLPDVYDLINFDRLKTMELLCRRATSRLWHRQIPLVWKRGAVSQKQQHHVSAVCFLHLLKMVECSYAFWFGSVTLCRIVVDLKEDVWYQKCHDPECRNFRSSSMSRSERAAILTCSWNNSRKHDLTVR